MELIFYRNVLIDTLISLQHDSPIELTKDKVEDIA